MELRRQITQLIYEALGEAEQVRQPEEALASCPDTVLMGDSAKLDSLGFVAFVAALEDKIERAFRIQMSLIDIMLSIDDYQWTVATLAERIEQMVVGDTRASLDTRPSARL